MSLTASMWTGVSGLLAHGEKMNVIGNNLANVSTVGFKGQRMDFADFVYQDSFSNAGTTQIGRGVKIGAVMQNFTGGPVETTTEATDLAISGRGFFKVNKIGTDQAYYTRAGNFRFNVDGYLVDPNGLAVQGWKVNNDNGVNLAAGGMKSAASTQQSDIIGAGVPMDVKLDTWTVPPQQTTKITFKSTLPRPGTDKARDSSNPFAGLFNVWNGSQPPASPSTPPIAVPDSCEYQTTMDVYDEGGTKHKVTIYYDRVDSADYDGDNSSTMWEYLVTMDPAEDERMYFDPTTGDLKKVNETKAGGVLMSGTMTFSGSGQLTNQSCYTWGGDQNTTDNPTSFSDVPDPSDPLKTVKVINLDPANLDNWYPAAISTNGYPVVVANFTGLLDAQTPGTDNGAKYNIEMDFGLKIGNYAMPWENRNSLGSLSVQPYAANTSGSGPDFVRMNPDYDPTADPLTDPNAYQYLFDVPGYPNDPYPANAAIDPAFQAVFRQVLLQYKGVDTVTIKAGQMDNTDAAHLIPPKDIQVKVRKKTGNTLDMEVVPGQTFTLGNSITVEKGAMDNTVSPPVPPVDITVALNSDGTIKANQTFPYNDGAGVQQIFDLDAAVTTYNGVTGHNFGTDIITPRNVFDLDSILAGNPSYPVTPGNPAGPAYTGGAATLNNSILLPATEDAIRANAVKDASVLTAATPANANHLAEINKPVVIDATTTINQGTAFSASQAQNGYGYGDLSSWNVDADGILYGVYSNGVTLPLWQLTLYDFNCTQGLRREGNNLFSKTRASGEAKSGPAGVAGLGSVSGYSLEQSNVDMSTEFVQMITTQRGFQSNSKIITTTDTMLDTVISMKR